MAVKVKLQGFRELEQALAELPKAVGKNVLRRVLKAAAAPMTRSAEAGAPEFSGHLVSVVTTGNQLSKRQRRLAGKATASFVGVGANGKASFKGKASTGVEIHLGPGTDRVFKGAPDPAGIFQEFGTVSNAAQPFMRPAWDANKTGALDIIAADLGQEIDKAAARVSARAARLARKAG